MVQGRLGWNDDTRVEGGGGPRIWGANNMSVVPMMMVVDEEKRYSMKMKMMMRKRRRRMGTARRTSSVVPDCRVSGGGNPAIPADRLDLLEASVFGLTEGKNGQCVGSGRMERPERGGTG